MSANTLTFVIFIFVFISLTRTGDSLKVLGLFPNYIKSHYDVFRPIMIGLAEKGHDVIVLSHFPNNPPVTGLTDLNLLGTLPLKNAGLHLELLNPHFKGLQMFFLLMELANMTCTATYSSDAMRSLLNSDLKFDVVVTEAFNSDCMLGLVHHFRVPHILVSSHVMMPWVHERFGNTENPAIIPNPFGRYSSTMTFFERLNNFIEVHVFKFLYYMYSDTETDKILEKVFGPDVPSVAKLKEDAALIMVNTHFSLTGVRPQVPAVVDIAGIHLQRVKPLDKELRDFINGADRGVIYVNVGTCLSDSKRDAMMQVFSLLNQRVLLRWDKDNLPDKPKNVLIRKWFPQRDVLAHKSVILFMTHGGILGVIEAVDAGVPMIVSPIYGDQFMNSASLCSRAVALEIPYDGITTERLFEEINNILTSPRYTENAKKLANVFRDRHLPPLETAVWWVEHIARTAGEELRILGRDMPLFQYFLVDVIVASIVIIAATLYILIYMIHKLLSIQEKTKEE